MEAILSTAIKRPTNLLPMCIIGGLFFIFGFVTWQNGALIPYLQMICQLSETEALLVASAFYFAFTVMALPSAIILERIGYKNGMAIGLLCLVVGFLFYIPAANSQQFGLFLFAQFIIGSGLTLLQTAANPYVVKIGPIESAAVRIMFMGLMNKGAGVLVPIVFTAIVLGDFAGINAVSLEAMAEPEKIITIAALADDEYLQTSIKVNNAGVKQLEAGFVKLGLTFITSSANFVAVEVTNANDVFEKLLAEGVIVRPVEMPNYLRVSVGTEAENARLLEALEAVL